MTLIIKNCWPSIVNNSHEDIICRYEGDKERDSLTAMQAVLVPHARVAGKWGVFGGGHAEKEYLLGSADGPIQCEAQVNVVARICEVEGCSKHVNGTDGEFISNKHIRFHYEDSELSEFSDSIQEVGGDERSFFEEETKNQDQEKS